MNRLLNRPTPLSLKSKLVEEFHQLDKYNPQKRKQQTQKKNMHNQSRTYKLIKDINLQKLQMNQSQDHSIAESIQVQQSTGIPSDIKNQNQSSKMIKFKLFQVPCSSRGSIEKNNSSINRMIINSKNQLQCSMTQSRSVQSISALGIQSNSKIQFGQKSNVHSGNHLQVDQPPSQIQSRVIDAINIKKDNKNCYQSSQRLNQFHPMNLQQPDEIKEQKTKSLFDYIFQNINSNSKASSNVNQQISSPQKQPCNTTQKKKPSQEEIRTPPSTLPINSRITEHQSPKRSRKNLKLHSVSRRLSEMKQETPAPKKNLAHQKQLGILTKQKTQILTLVACLSKNNPNQHIESLRNRMVNQKNLKLRDYLRLASLSSDARFDNYKKQSRNLKCSSTNHLKVSSSVNILKKSSLFNKQKSIIDPQKSIQLIKRSLKKKLQKSVEMALRVFEQIQSSKQIIGKQYEDLVFMCNLHRLFDQNIFKASQLLQSLFQQYVSKRKFHTMLQQKHQITEETVIQILSPRKKKKNQQLPMNIFQQLLLGLKIIKKQQLR